MFLAARVMPSSASSSPTSEKPALRKAFFRPFSRTVFFPKTFSKPIIENAKFIAPTIKAFVAMCSTE